MNRKSRIRVVASLVVVAGLAGCSSSVVRTGEPVPAVAAPRSGGPVKVSQPKYGATVIVRKGDNVYRIATNNGITALDLALWNNIPPPYIIRPGSG
jgi:LysM domain.